MTPEELDRWAAEKVMGWKLRGAAWHEPKVGWHSAYFDKTDFDEWFKNGTSLPKNKIKFLEKDWHPSTDANQCFMVVEKMRELGWQMQLWSLKHEYAAVFYLLTFRDWRELRERDYVKYDSPCLAILQAAHAALKGE